MSLKYIYSVFNYRRPIYTIYNTETGSKFVSDRPFVQLERRFPMMTRDEVAVKALRQLERAVLDSPYSQASLEKFWGKRYTTVETDIESIKEKQGV